MPYEHTCDESEVQYKQNANVVTFVNNSNIMVHENISEFMAVIPGEMITDDEEFVAWVCTLSLHILCVLVSCCTIYYYCRQSSTDTTRHARLKTWYYPTKKSPVHRPTKPCTSSPIRVAHQSTKVSANLPETYNYNISPAEYYMDNSWRPRRTKRWWSEC